MRVLSGTKPTSLSRRSGESKAQAPSVPIWSSSALSMVHLREPTSAVGDTGAETAQSITPRESEQARLLAFGGPGATALGLQCDYTWPLRGRDNPGSETPVTEEGSRPL